ncbi:replication protein [Enterobacteriaceae bacterium ESL0689]|nr:replication protein [Enterobacteriaceae bacterium ESL0689]
MTNTAEIIKFPVPEAAPKEPRVAELDDGYTRIANELYEELIGANLTKNQAKVAHAVCRKTYGFNKKVDRISDSQIAQLTNLPRQKVNAAKNELLAMKVLISEGGLIGPNKNLNEWDIPDTKAAPKCHHNSDCHHSGDTVPTVVTKSVTKTVTGLSPQWGHTKDTITKDKKDNINKPPIVPLVKISGKSEKSQKRATQFPENFTPTENNQRLANELCVDLQAEMAAFSDYHRSKGSTYKDWNLALNTWLRNAVKFGRCSHPAQPQSVAKSRSENFSAKDYGKTEIPDWARD